MAAALQARVVRHVTVAPETGCWLWTGKRNASGYGVMEVDGKSQLAHRVSYTTHVGPIESGMQLDHTCHQKDACPGGSGCIHRRCVNPQHLEPVTPNENTARGNHPAGVVLRTGRCQRGHQPDFYVRPDGKRGCRPCRAAARTLSDKTAARVAAVLDEMPSASLRQVAERAGVSKASAHRIKRWLLNEGSAA